MSEQLSCAFEIGKVSLLRNQISEKLKPTLTQLNRTNPRPCNRGIQSYVLFGEVRSYAEI